MDGDMETTAAVAALTALAEHGIPPDIQELLVYGNPTREIKPGALSKAVSAVIRVAVGQSVTKEPLRGG